MLITLLLALICILLIKKIPSNDRKTTISNSHHTREVIVSSDNLVTSGRVKERNDFNFYHIMQLCIPCNSYDERKNICSTLVELGQFNKGSKLKIRYQISNVN